MEFETVDYTDEMVIVKNNENEINKGKKERQQIEAHYSQLQCHIYIYIFIGKYIYIYKYNTIILHGNSAETSCIVYCHSQSM